MTLGDVRQCCSSCDAELVQEHWSELLDVPVDFMGGSKALVFSPVFCFVGCWLKSFETARGGGEVGHLEITTDFFLCPDRLKSEVNSKLNRLCKML